MSLKNVTLKAINVISLETVVTHELPLHRTLGQVADCYSSIRENSKMWKVKYPFAPMRILYTYSVSKEVMHEVLH